MRLFTNVPFNVLFYLYCLGLYSKPLVVQATTPPDIRGRQVKAARNELGSFPYIPPPGAPKQPGYGTARDITKPAPKNPKPVQTVKASKLTPIINIPTISLQAPAEGLEKNTLVEVSSANNIKNPTLTPTSIFNLKSKPPIFSNTHTTIVTVTKPIKIQAPPSIKPSISSVVSKPAIKSTSSPLPSIRSSRSIYRSNTNSVQVPPFTINTIKSTRRSSNTITSIKRLKPAIKLIPSPLPPIRSSFSIYRPRTRPVQVPPSTTNIIKSTRRSSNTITSSIVAPSKLTKTHSGAAKHTLNLSKSPKPATTSMAVQKSISSSVSKQFVVQSTTLIASVIITPTILSKNIKEVAIPKSTENGKGFLDQSEIGTTAGSPSSDKINPPKLTNIKNTNGDKHPANPVTHSNNPLTSIGLRTSNRVLQDWQIVIIVIIAGLFLFTVAITSFLTYRYRQATYKRKLIPFSSSYQIPPNIHTAKGKLTETSEQMFAVNPAITVVSEKTDKDISVVEITFNLYCNHAAGNEYIVLIGADCALGNWQLSGAPCMKLMGGARYGYTATLPVDCVIEYKYAIVCQDGTARYMEGPSLGVITGHKSLALEPTMWLKANV